MQHKDFHILSPFTVKAAATPPHDPNMTDTGDAEILKIAGVANFYGDADTGEVFIDLADEVVVPSGMDVSIWKGNPQILWQHKRDMTVGRGTSITKKKSGLHVEAEVHAGSMCPEDFYRVKAGLVAYLSIGFRVLAGNMKKVGDKYVYVIEKSQLYEISLVSLPCNTESSFQIVKSLPDDQGFYAGELKNFSQPIDNDSQPHKGEENMLKGKVRDFLSADAVKEMEAKGLSAQLDAEKEITFPELKEMIKTEIKAELAVEAATEKEAAEAAQKEADEKAAAELAEKEAKEAEEKAAAELAEKEAQEAEEAESIKSLEDIVASLKTLVTE